MFKARRLGFGVSASIGAIFPLFVWRTLRR
jgi:hypothetical protein